MYKLNKNELKKVVGGQTLIEYALATSAGFLQALSNEGWQDEVLLAFLSLLLGNGQINIESIISHGPGELIEDSRVIIVTFVDGLIDGDRAIFTKKNVAVTSVGSVV